MYIYSEAIAAAMLVLKGLAKRLWPFVQVSRIPQACGSEW